MHRRKKGAAMRMQAGQCGHWCTKIPAFTGREYTGLREPGLGHAGTPIQSHHRFITLAGRVHTEADASGFKLPTPGARPQEG